jgi:hypothetical protein
MIEIKILSSETMLGSCLCMVFFQVVLNHNPLNKPVFVAHIVETSLTYWDILHYGP